MSRKPYALKHNCHSSFISSSMQSVTEEFFDEHQLGAGMFCNSPLHPLLFSLASSFWGFFPIFLFFETSYIKKIYFKLCVICLSVYCIWVQCLRRPEEGTGSSKGRNRYKQLDLGAGTEPGSFGRAVFGLLLISEFKLSVFCQLLSCISKV